MPKTDARILKIAKKITAKRPKTVIDHILKHGYVTTQELRDLHGYNHPPRAIRDVREEGIPIETFRVTGSDGRRIGAYRFGDPSAIQQHKLGGRKVFSKAFKRQLIELYGSRCAITGEEYNSRYLQIDHRIPYEVAGDKVANEGNPKGFMLLSGAAQRQKSWTCESCQNLQTHRDVSICSNCYWASPETYEHVAMVPMRRTEIVWTADELELYALLIERSKREGKTIQRIIKELAGDYSA